MMTKKDTILQAYYDKFTVEKIASVFKLSTDRVRWILHQRGVAGILTPVQQAQVDADTDIGNDLLRLMKEGRTITGAVLAYSQGDFKDPEKYLLLADKDIRNKLIYCADKRALYWEWKKMFEPS